MIDFKNRNILLSLTAVAFALFGFWINDPLDLFSANYKNAPLVLSEFSADDIEQVSLLDGKQLKLTFARQTSGWNVVVEGKTYRGNSQNIENAIKDLYKMKKYRVVSSNEKKFSDYQVTDESTKLKIKATGKNKAEISIILGKPGETYNSTLIRIEGEKKIYSVSGTLKSTWSQNADYFRDKKLLSFVKENILDYTVKGNNNYSAKTDAQGNWTIKLKRKEFAGDKSKIEGILNQLTALVGNSFYRENKIPKKLYSIHLTLKSKNEQQLDVYGPTKDNHYIVKTSNSGDYLKIAKATIDAIALEPLSLEYKAPAVNNKAQTPLITPTKK